MAAPHSQSLSDEEHNEIAELTRALFDADVAGVAPVTNPTPADTEAHGTEAHGTALNVVATRAGLTQPLPTDSRLIGATVKADPQVLRTTEPPFSDFIGIAIPDTVGGVGCVLWAGCLTPHNKIADVGDDLFRVLGRQLRRRFDSAEEQRQGRNASLSISESAGVLASNLTRAEASNRDLENFAYVASHELQRPLNTISAIAEVLRFSITQNKPLSQPSTASALAQIEDNARQLQQQISTLLTMARIDPEPDVLEAVDLNQLVQETTEQLTSLIKATKAEVIITALPTIESNRAMLGSVFRNLLSNAIIYSSPVRPPVIELRAIRSHSWHEIEVADNGPGVPTQDHLRIFEMFERGLSQQPGSGLGLALCQRLISELGGEIGVADRHPEGSRFWFRLPTATPDPTG